MFTTIAAFIDAKYNADFTMLYIGTVCVDLMVCITLTEIFSK